MVTVTVALVPGVIEAGLNVAVMPAGTLAVSPTAVFAAPLSVTPIEKVRVFPTIAEPDVDDCVNAKLGPLTGLVPEPQLLRSTAPSTEPRPVARL
jgi:hypothetical protein